MASDPAHRAERLRILVVDDNHDAADALVNLLRFLGHDSLARYDGQTALDVSSVFRPQVILLDLAMPNIDGLKVLSELRNDGSAGIPIIAITSFADTRHQAEAMAAGFDGYLVKPSTVDDLMMMIRKTIRHRPSESPN